MITKEQAIQLLNDMGTTADEVAAFLKSKGIKGRPCEATSCPVANYMVSQGGDPTGAVYDRYNHGADYVVETPAPVFAFIRYFDWGKYPELKA
jgi:hypothetical protein